MYEKDAASQALGITIEIPEVGQAIATMLIRDDMVNGFDVCHGGLIFTLADTAFAFACYAFDQLSYGAAAVIVFLRPAKRGVALEACAKYDYRGNKTGLYSIVFRNQRDEVVAMFRGRSATVQETVL